MTPPSTLTAPYREVPLSALTPSPLNPRKHFDPVKLQELADTMGDGVGVIEPLVVRPNGTATTFEIIAGERRYRSAQLAGLETVPVVVKDLEDAQVLEIMLVENNARQDIAPLEEAAGFKAMLAFGFDVDKLAARLGRGRRYIFDRIKLLDLLPEAQRLLTARRIEIGHAIALSRIPQDRQREAINPACTALFVGEGGLFGPGGREERSDPYNGLKAQSVRELQAWIDQRVRFDPSAPVNVELFPETQEVLEDADKVVSITHSHHTHPDAKDGTRIYSTVSWKRADGQEKAKTCEKSVTGVVVAGWGRGQAFKVCVNKTCKVHWAAAARATTRRRHQQATETPEATGKREAKEAAARATKQEASEVFKVAERRGLERVATSTKKLTRALLTAVVVEVLENSNDMERGHFLDLFKLRSGNGYYIHEKDLAAHSEIQLVQMLTYAIVSNKLPFSEDPKRHAAAFKPYGVEFTKLLADVKRERAAATKAASKAGASQQTPTPGTCRYCGCTEDDACGDGCSWLDNSQTVCDAPACEQAHAKALGYAKAATPAAAAKKKPAKKAVKAKSGKKR